MSSSHFLQICFFVTKASCFLNVSRLGGGGTDNKQFMWFFFDFLHFTAVVRTDPIATLINRELPIFIFIPTFVVTMHAWCKTGYYIFLLLVATSEKTIYRNLFESLRVTLMGVGDSGSTSVSDPNKRPGIFDFQSYEMSLEPWSLWLLPSNYIGSCQVRIAEHDVFLYVLSLSEIDDDVQ